MTQPAPVDAPTAGEAAWGVLVWGALEGAGVDEDGAAEDLLGALDVVVCVVEGAALDEGAEVACVELG